MGKASNTIAIKIWDISQEFCNQWGDGVFYKDIKQAKLTEGSKRQEPKRDARKKQRMRVAGGKKSLEEARRSKLR